MRAGISKLCLQWWQRPRCFMLAKQSSPANDNWNEAGDVGIKLKDNHKPNIIISYTLHSYLRNAGLCWTACVLWLSMSMTSALTRSQRPCLSCWAVQHATTAQNRRCVCVHMCACFISQALVQRPPQRSPCLCVHPSKRASLTQPSTL